MIWVAGRIVGDDELSVSVLDRTFEHGLGLFETLRTWNGRAVLLTQHLERLRHSAHALGLPIDPAAVPDETAVEALLRAINAETDVVLRLTLSGGRSPADGSMLWMRAMPLPPPLTHREGAMVSIGDWPILESNLLARHKCLNYWERRLAYDRARKLGFDEALSTSSHGTIWEGSRTNVFIVQGESLLTPSLSGPIVPGIMRRLVMELAKSLPLMVSATDSLSYQRLHGIREVFLTNSVRGIVPVGRATVYDNNAVRSHCWPAPGPWTQRLSILLADHLNGRGNEES